MWVRLSVLAVVLWTAAAMMAEPPRIQNADSQYRVPGEYHVVLKPVEAKSDKAKYVEDTTVKVKAISENIKVVRNFVFTKLIILVVHCEDEEVVTQIFNLPEVKDIEANLNQPGISQSCVHQDTDSYLWGLSRISARTLPDYDGARYEYKSGDGSNTYAYVVDSGIHILHNDYNGRATRGYTAENLENTEGSEDLNGHGTHCAGTVMSTTYGVAKSAIAIAVKIINRNGFYTGTNFLDGVNWMYNDFVDKVNSQGDAYKAVASMSLGGGGSSTNDAAVQECIDAGLSVVVAAMNENTNACDYSPARMNDVVTVGATDSADRLASFSNWGTCVDILGPGVNILSTFPGSGNDNTNIYSGTSMATPHVAGAILRYMSQLPARPSPAAVRSWLSSTATPDVCDLRGHTSTPNLLLHTTCTLNKGARLPPVLAKSLSMVRGVHPALMVDPLFRSFKLEPKEGHGHHPDHRPDQPGQCPDSMEWSEMKHQMQVTFDLAIATIALLALTFVISLCMCCRTMADAETLGKARERWYLSNAAHSANIKPVYTINSDA